MARKKEEEVVVTQADLDAIAAKRQELFGGGDVIKMSKIGEDEKNRIHRKYLENRASLEYVKLPS